MSEHEGLKYLTPDTAVMGSVLTNLAWGALLILPGNSLVSSQMAYLLLFGGDGTWAIGMFSAALAQLWCLKERKKETRSRLSILLGFIVSFSVAMLWTFIAILCMVSAWPVNPMVGSTAVIAGGMWWDFSRFDPQTSAQKLKELQAFESWKVPMRRRTGER